MDLTPWYEARDEITERLRLDLIGEAGTHDLIQEAPLSRFVVGILYPVSDAPPQPEDANVEDQGGDDGEVDETPVPLAKTMRPSSMGFTFYVRVGEPLRVSFRAGRYSKNEDGWHRSPVEVDETWFVGSGRWVIFAEDDLVVEAYGRSAAEGFAVTVSARLTSIVDPGKQDSQCLFQCELSAETDAGFQTVPAPPVLLDDEEAATAMLYRNRRTYALGHACSVDWDDTSTVKKVWSTFMPTYDLALANASRDDVPALEMFALTEKDRASSLCAELIVSYRRWISERQNEVGSLPAGHRQAALGNLEAAAKAANRMDEGLALLQGDPAAWRAFELMNASMRRQRLRDASGDEPAWRPFQLAFILMNLSGLTDSKHPDREVADLLWFPTGGGKTEAYLGLIAYVLWLRRLRDPNDAGLSVLMRYTLRLLTLDQFERASVLISAMELIREAQMPEAAEFTIGLWVGQATTPNSLGEAVVSLAKLHDGISLSPDDPDPTQLKHCPWCGKALPSRAYQIAHDRMTVMCTNLTCAFSSRPLPVILIDEELYSRRPSMVIATADKFALMAWQQNIRRLFSRDGANSSLSLIIQDELHLISGPLGTLTGLYEVAVDLLGTGEARPKIAASTATIRRSAGQVRAVFDREPALFPPPGLHPEDNFFAVDAPAEQKGNRRYVGVLSGGQSHATLMIRVTATLLQAAAELEAPDDVRDAYWSLVAYYNSLRVLGAAVVQYHDDVPDVMKYLAGDEEPRPLWEVVELTSRKTAQEIRDTKAALATPMGDEAAIDIVAATSMISVGLDVERLGLMTVMGQPQASAEYIQATSRVGRSRPGLVIDILNAARTRDLSHFEGFKAFHNALYRQVEPVSVTPFAARARDRGLHGAFVSAVRALVPQLNARPVADRAIRPQLESIIALFEERCRRIDPEEADALRAELNSLVDQWIDWAQIRVPTKVKYEGWRDRQDKLLVPAVGGSDFPVSSIPWATLTSLRNVDAESEIRAAPDLIQQSQENR